MAEVLLTRLYPALLCALLASWLALLPSALGRLRRRLALARPRTASLLLLLVLGGLALRAAVVRPARLVYDDEFEQLDAARHLAAGGVYAETLAGGLPGFDVLAPATWPAGHPVALAAIFRLFGNSGTFVAEAWSALLSALIALWIFWAALELFGDERGALAAAFIWAVSPLALRYSGAVDTSTPSLFWCAAAFAALSARESEPSPALDAFAAVSLAYAVQVRFENALLIAYALFAVKRRALVVPAALGLVFPAAIVWANHAGGLPGFAAATFAPWPNFLRQAPSNAAFFAAPAALGLLAAPAAAASLGRAPARRLFLLAAALFVVYSCYYHGEFRRDTDDRYYLAVLLPLSLAAAPALASAALPAVLLTAGLAWRLAPGADPAHEAARRFLADSAPLLPGTSYVVTFNPSFVREISGRPAVWSPLLLEDAAAFDRGRTLVRSSPDLVLYKDWTWRERPEDAANMENALRGRYEAKVLASDGVDSLVLMTPK
ncbi:MAG: glycosyltransferase family 39 protein [Elusimicrobiota bacterium]